MARTSVMSIVAIALFDSPVTSFAQSGSGGQRRRCRERVFGWHRQRRGLAKCRLLRGPERQA
jgi:hypothetical protein